MSAWMEDTGEQVAALADLSSLAIGSVILSNHGTVWQCQISGWSSISGQSSKTPDQVWATEKGIRSERRFRVLYRKPGAPWAEQLTFLRSAFEMRNNREVAG